MKMIWMMMNSAHISSLTKKFMPSKLSNDIKIFLVNNFCGVVKFCLSAINLSIFFLRNLFNHLAVFIFLAFFI